MTTIEQARRDPRFVLLTSVLTSMLQVKALDMLERTTYYKHLVKMASKKLVKELEAHIIPDVELVCGENDKVLYNIMNDMELCIERLAMLPPEHFRTVSEMIDMLLKNPNEILQKLQIKEIDANTGTSEPI